MKLLNAQQMRELDRQAIEECGLPGIVLMENAGRAATEQLLRRFSDLAPGPVLILAGKGNNGGDGYVIARHLLNAGWRVETLVLATAEQIGGDAGINLRVLRKSGGRVHFASGEADLPELLSSLPVPVLLVDALFGTGLNAPVRGLAAVAIDWINASGLPVLAVDIPSGIDATSGRVLGSAVRADLTVSFACAKLGHWLSPGAEYVGELALVDIGIPRPLSERLEPAASLVDKALAARLFPARPRTGHKGTFGHLLVVAGSRGKTGAALLAAGAGLRSGAGLVTLAVPGSEQATVAARFAELMVEPLADREGVLVAGAETVVRQLVGGKQAVVIGPGLGQAPETQALIRQLVTELPQPLVIDADGLNALVGDLGVLGVRAVGSTVLTPHPGEMARLCGLDVPSIEIDRPGIAHDFAVRHRVVLVLKGSRTLVATPDGDLLVNASGNPLLATGGTGDVLAGMIGGLLAQGLPAKEAAPLAVYWHGYAADRLAHRFGDAGMLAGDLLQTLPAARAELCRGGRQEACSPTETY